MNRDELEAVIWRHWPGRGPSDCDAVEAILDAADAYGLALANSIEDSAASTAERRRVLCEALDTPRSAA